VAASLALSGKEFLAVAKFAVISHLPLVIVEGLISSVALVFIKKIKPEMLKGDLD
jgi:cobalt/nickel transport system permease protein